MKIIASKENSNLLSLKLKKSIIEKIIPLREKIGDIFYNLK